MYCTTTKIMLLEFWQPKSKEVEVKNFKIYDVIRRYLPTYYRNMNLCI